MDNTNTIDRPALAETIPGHTPNRKRKQATNISQQNPSHQPVQQPIPFHEELHLPVTPQLSQQNESCVPLTQLSQQNKWHDIPVHQQLSQQNPLQIPLLHQLSPQQSQSSVQVPKQLFQQNQSLGHQQQPYPYNSNMYNQNQPNTSNGQNSFNYTSMLMNNNDHQFQQDIQVPPIRQSLETAYNWPISSHTSSFSESGTSIEPLIKQPWRPFWLVDRVTPSSCNSQPGVGIQPFDTSILDQATHRRRVRREVPGQEGPVEDPTVLPEVPAIPQVSDLKEQEEPVQKPGEESLPTPKEPAAAQEEAVKEVDPMAFKKVIPDAWKGKEHPYGQDHTVGSRKEPGDLVTGMSRALSQTVR
ncbi:nuclear transcription factor Y subunit beta-like [Mytilus edulis]|uniref:nuclear transcription factor Y subunit beta-like n=1 Tax=Mytilus edulis TaxID=6550 RepID=UPI0039EE7633